MSRSFAHSNKRVTTGGSAVQSLYAYDPSGATVVDYDTVHGLSQFAWLGGEPIAVMKANIPYFIHGDHLGVSDCPRHL